jgi:hypothetical protein
MLKAMSLFFPYGKEMAEGATADANVDDAQLWEDMSEDETEKAFSEVG